MTLVSTGTRRGKHNPHHSSGAVGMVLSNSIKCMNMDHETIVLSSIVTVVGEWGEKIIRCVCCRQTQQPLLFMRARTLIVSTQCALSHWQHFLCTHWYKGPHINYRNKRLSPEYNKSAGPVSKHQSVSAKLPSNSHAADCLVRSRQPASGCREI